MSDACAPAMKGGDVVTDQDLSYYRQRAADELSAADRAQDPAIAQIHREMAQRYHDLLRNDASPMNGAFRAQQLAGEAVA